jgi:hypothetical protein
VLALWSANIALVVDKLILGQVPLQVLLFSAGIIISPLINILAHTIWITKKGPLDAQFHRDIASTQRFNNNDSRPLLY